jgi:hypothetical protein
MQACRGVSLLFPLAIGRHRRVDVLSNRIREVELTSKDALVLDKDLEVNVGCAPWIPAGIDSDETHLSARPGKLHPT